MFEIDLDLIAKKMCLFPEFPTIVTNKRFRGDKMIRDLLKQIRKSEGSTVKLVFLLLTCSVNQERLAFVITRDAIVKMAAIAGLSFDTSKYGSLINLLEESGMFRIAFIERGSRKPMVIEVIEKSVVGRFAAVDVESQLKACIAFAKDETRFEPKDETGTRSGRKTPPSKSKEAAVVQEGPESSTAIAFSIPDYSYCEMQYQPTPASLAKIPEFHRQLQAEVTKLPGIGSSKASFEAFGEALRALAEMALPLFNGYGQNCHDYSISEKDAVALIEQKLRERFVDKSGAYALDGPIAARARESVMGELSAAIKSRATHIHLQPIDCPVEEYEVVKKVHNQLERNREAEFRRSFGEDRPDEEIAEADMAICREFERRSEERRLAGLRNSLDNELKRRADETTQLE